MVKRKRTNPAKKHYNYRYIHSHLQNMKLKLQQ